MTEIIDDYRNDRNGMPRQNATVLELKKFIKKNQNAKKIWVWREYGSLYITDEYCRSKQACTYIYEINLEIKHVSVRYGHGCSYFLSYDELLNYFEGGAC